MCNEDLTFPQKNVEISQKLMQTDSLEKVAPQKNVLQKEMSNEEVSQNMTSQIETSQEKPQIEMSQIEASQQGAAEEEIQTQNETSQKEKRLEEQENVLKNTKKNMLVSASAGSGKTFVMIKYICQLIAENSVPINDFLVLTFTKAAAAQMKEKLLKRLKECCKEEQNEQKRNFLLEQIDQLPTANICTIDSFCERCVKKYASTLDVNENFSVVDENQAISLKNIAFKTAMRQFMLKNSANYEFLMTTYKNEVEKIQQIVKTLEDISNAVADKKAFLSEISGNFEEKFDSACKFLYEDAISTIRQKIEEMEGLHVDKYFCDVKTLLADALAANDLFELHAAVQQIGRFPTRPSQKAIGQEVFEQLGELKDAISDKVGCIKCLNLDDEQNVGVQKSGALEKAVLQLFDLYEKEYFGLKKAQNSLDFADLEKYMQILSENANLFGQFQYVFVDEYQDTNKMQEKIVKNVAKNCNFVAVGDLKQGIYGFRLASSDIFLKDLKQFEADEDAAVNFLRSNFRSSQKVLDFVNDIFKVCMTEDVAKVDYLATSMLKSENDFAAESEKAVHIDIIAKKTPTYDEIPLLYSVKNAPLAAADNNKLMLEDIKNRILQVVGSQISDGGKLRPAEFGDIAILARGRDSLFSELETFLQENDIPVLSNSRSDLTKEPEIQMLVNYLRLAVCLDDEIALASVLLSGLYLFDLQKIFDEKVEKQEGLLEIVKKNESGYYSKFLKDLDDFRLESSLFGAKKAFMSLFAKTNYFSYLNLRKGKEKLFMFVQKFLSEVEKQDFDLPALVNYFDTVSVVVTPEASSFGDAVTLTTIHDSKGLEYPVVFLIGCDKNFCSNDGSDVQINEKFGMALKVYDTEDNSVVPSVRLVAIKEQEREKDFVEELMIFYVALTRAKNRLYLFGSANKGCFSKHSVKRCSTYFDLIFFALRDVAQEFCKTGEYVSENLCVTAVDELEFVPQKVAQNFENAEFDPKIVERIEKYVDFSYKFGASKNFRLKESVTNLTKKMEEDNALAKFSNDNFQFSGNAVQVGNAYHLALKLLNFEEVSDERTLDEQLQKIAGQVDESLLDRTILLKNILILKKITSNARVFKEKEFLLKEKISKLLDEDAQDEILVQGIVDLFAVRDEKIVLVDYKYSSSQSETYLIEKYKNQLKLYKNALENAFKMPVSDCYLLSLKFGQLIEVKF